MVKWTRELITNVKEELPEFARTVTKRRVEESNADRTKQESLTHAAVLGLCSADP